MAALTLDALLRSPKKGASVPEPVYLLYGDEDVLKDEAIRALVDATVGSSRDFNLDVRFAPDLTPESFHALVNTPPMLAERRAVVIRGVDQLGKRKTKLRDEVLRYLASPNPTTLLVLVVAAGEEADPEMLRASTGVEVDALAAERVPRWLHHRASTLGLTLAQDASVLLLQAVGNDLSTLSRELEKLASLSAGTSRPVTAEDVSSLVGVRRGETVFDLVEAALERRAAQGAQPVGPGRAAGGGGGRGVLCGSGTAPGRSGRRREAAGWAVRRFGGWNGGPPSNRPTAEPPNRPDRCPTRRSPTSRPVRPGRFRPRHRPTPPRRTPARRLLVSTSAAGGSEDRAQRGDRRLVSEPHRGRIRRRSLGRRRAVAAHPALLRAARSRANRPGSRTAQPGLSRLPAEAASQFFRGTCLFRAQERNPWMRAYPAGARRRGRRCRIQEPGELLRLAVRGSAPDHGRDDRLDTHAERYRRQGDVRSTHLCGTGPRREECGASGRDPHPAQGHGLRRARRARLHRPLQGARRPLRDAGRGSPIAAAPQAESRRAAIRRG